MRSARDDQGFALVAAIILLTVMMGLGLGLLLFTDNQQKASAREQASESAFNVAEAALNAQVGQLSRAWPAKESEAYPDNNPPGLVRCTATTSTPNSCPDPASLSAGYPNISPVPCAAGAATEKWGSPLTNQWTTYVRDDGGSTGALFNSATDQTQPGWDANGDNKLWVRSVGVVQCRVVTLITLVTRQRVAVPFPHNAATANWFKVTNSGKKRTVNTAGEPTGEFQPGEISMRCEEPPVPGSRECEVWSKAKQQIEPDTTLAPKSPSPTWSNETLAALKAEAQAAGTFHSAAKGNCPSTLAETSGLPAYVEGCGPLKISGGIGNSVASPGFLILADGTLELVGKAEFYGVIYARNPSPPPSGCSCAVVSLGGAAVVKGAIDVDGNGGIEFGSSGQNFIFDPSAINPLTAYAGATPTRNTFRVLPASQ
jgi:type II secretory pathway pseudopilin PulG